MLPAAEGSRVGIYTSIHQAGGNKRHDLTILNAWRCVLHCNMTWCNFIIVWHHPNWLCVDKVMDEARPIANILTTATPPMWPHTHP